MVEALIISRNRRRLTLAHLSRDVSKATVKLNGMMVVNIKVTTEMGRRMVMALSSSQMETFILGNSWTERCMASRSLLMSRREASVMVNGVMESA